MQLHEFIFIVCNLCTHAVAGIFLIEEVLDSIYTATTLYNYVYIYIHIYIDVCMYVCVCMYIYIHVCVYIYRGRFRIQDRGLLRFRLSGRSCGACDHCTYPNASGV